MDLPNHSVLIGGLDSWSTGGDEVIEPRLVDKLKSLFDMPLQVLKLFSPPPDADDPTAPQTGITVPGMVYHPGRRQREKSRNCSSPNVGASQDADQG